MEAAVEYGLARCARCGVMYEQSDLGLRCYYHSGEYHNHDGNRICRTWSCCNTADEAARGCCIDVDGHVRCEQTAKALSNFPQDETAVNGLRHRGTCHLTTPDHETAKATKRSTKPEGSLEYVVGVCDTLSSVALKHGMTVAQLKRWNTVLNSKLYPGQTLAVVPPPPKTAEQVRADNLRALMHKAQCTRPEAEYYLDEHGDGINMAAALAALNTDVQGTAADPTAARAVSMEAASGF
jgi:LysM repeat protein